MKVYDTELRLTTKVKSRLLVSNFNFQIVLHKHDVKKSNVGTILTHICK